jgi:hypothetical protein
MTATIRISKGEYRNTPVINKTFTLVKGYQTGAKGGFVTVKNGGHFPNVSIENVKVKVDGIDKIKFIDGAPEMIHSLGFKIAEPEVVETETEAMDRIATRFAVLDEMSSACIAGNIRAMIVTGPAGIGKSHGVTMQMEKASMFDKITGKRPRFEIVKGAISGIGLFATLYKYSDAKNVLVFDDCDVWEDQDALNVLKGALDSGKTRRISWNKDSRLLRDEGVPNTFNFNGSIIFITNKTFDSKKASKIQPHLDALQSRCHFLDLTVDTERDKMLRIKQVHRDADGGLFADYDFEQVQTDEIMSFIDANHNKLREVSLRMCLKIADLVKISTNWRELAKATCMKAN